MISENYKVILFFDQISNKQNLRHGLKELIIYWGHGNLRQHAWGKANKIVKQSLCYPIDYYFIGKPRRDTKGCSASGFTQDLRFLWIGYEVKLYLRVVSESLLIL